MAGYSIEISGLRSRWIVVVLLFLGVDRDDHKHPSQSQIRYSSPRDHFGMTGSGLVQPHVQCSWPSFFIFLHSMHDLFGCS